MPDYLDLQFSPFITKRPRYESLLRAPTQTLYDTSIGAGGYSQPYDAEDRYAEARFSSGVFSGEIVGGTLHIGQEGTSAVRVDENGNTWWGARTLAAAPASVTNAGVATFTSITVTGYVPTGGAGADVNSGAVSINANRINISGSTTFTAGYDPSQKIADSAYGVGGRYASASSGARVLVFPDANTGIQVIDNGGADVFKALVGGTDVGDVTIGNYAGSQGMKYDKSTGAFTFKGIIDIDSAAGGFSCLTYAYFRGSTFPSTRYGVVRHDDTNFLIQSEYGGLNLIPKDPSKIILTGHTKPNADSLWDIGESANRHANIYADQFFGALDAESGIISTKGSIYARDVTNPSTEYLKLNHDGSNGIITVTTGHLGIVTTDNQVSHVGSYVSRATTSPSTRYLTINHTGTGSTIAGTYGNLELSCTDGIVYTNNARLRSTSSPTTRYIEMYADASYGYIASSFGTVRTSSILESAASIKVFEAGGYTGDYVSMYVSSGLAYYFSNTDILVQSSSGYVTVAANTTLSLSAGAGGVAFNQTVYPTGTAGTKDMGTAAAYWNTVNCKDVVDRAGTFYADPRSAYQIIRQLRPEEGNGHCRMLEERGQQRIKFTDLPAYAIDLALEESEEDIVFDDNTVIDNQIDYTEFSPNEIIARKGELTRWRIVPSKDGKKHIVQAAEGLGVTAFNSILLGAVKQLMAEVEELKKTP